MLKLSKRCILGVLMVFGCGVTFASLALNAYLVQRIKASDAAIEASSAAVNLMPGSKAPRLDLLDLGGKRVAIDTWNVQTGTVVYVFRPGCIWCLRNERSIGQLATAAGERFRFIGVSLTANGVAAYLAEHPLPFPTYVITETSARAYGLTGTPTTLVIAPSGHLLQIWNGAFLGKNRKGVSDFFMTPLGDDPGNSARM